MQMKPILYADDEPDDIFFMQRAFEQAGIEQPLLTVNSGNELITYLSGQGKYADRIRYPLPALVLVDLNMPQGSGFESLKWIRNKPSLSTLPVLVITSSNHESDIQRASLLGANGYLVKPSKLDDLFEVVKAFKGYWLTHDRLTNEVEPKEANEALGTTTYDAFSSTPVSPRYNS